MPPAKPAQIKPHKFNNLPYYVWKVMPDDPDTGEEFTRPFVIIVEKFKKLREWLVVVEYDSMKQVGWQRAASESHYQAIARDMARNEFTPTGWVASADEWHVKNLEFPDVPEGSHPVVNLKVNNEHRLRLSDGNHRYESLKFLLDKALEDGDAARVRAIENTYIDLKVLLSPSYILSDFVRLQKGKAVSLNTIKAMDLASGNMSEEKLENTRYATRLARILSEIERSHLFHNIAFDKPDAKRVQYSSVIADAASSQSTTLYGGALIGMKFGRELEWMAERYVEAYQLLGEDKGEDGKPYLYSGTKKLKPANLEGTKGGSHLLIGLGSVLAYRLCILGKFEPDQIDREELEHFREVGTKKFEHGRSGGSATEKRVDMNAFVKAYFADLKDEVEMYEGIPLGLIFTTSISAWGIDGKAFNSWKAKNPKKVQAYLKPDKEEASDEDDAVEEPAPKRRGRAKAKTEYEPEQVMAGGED